MDKIKIYDANNWIRVQFECDPSGMALRNLFNEAYLDTKPQLWIFDGKNSKAKRREIYPGYKAKRPSAPDNFYVTLNIFKELLTFTNKVQVEVPGYEADDIIAQMTRGNPLQKFDIQSTDRDYYALHTENVTQNRPGIDKIDPLDTRLYKTLVGDSSDNVPGVKGFGKGSYPKLDAGMKSNWVAILNGNIDIDKCHCEMLGLSLTQFNWSLANIDLLKAFWKVVDFIPVPPELIAAGTKVGTPNYARAQEILSGLFLGDNKPSMANMKA